MGAEHDELVAEYQKYKDDLAEYEKQVYYYESKLVEYGETLVQKISKLKELGITLETLSKIVDSEGNLDLTNENNIRLLLNEVYELYKSNIQIGLDELKDRK